MPIMPAGTHVVNVTSHVISKSKVKGTPCVNIGFANEAGQHITYYGYLSAGALPYTMEALEVLGWDAKASGGRIDALNGSMLLVGAECQIEVEEEEFDGKKTLKVKWVNEIGGGFAAEMEKENAEALSLELRALVLEHASGPKPQQAKTPDAPETPAEPAEDDMPF